MDWSILWQYRTSIWNGFETTVWLSAAAIVGSTLVGVAIGCLGATPSFFLRRGTALYTEVLRNLPIIVKMFFFYFVLGMPAVPAALLSLVLHQSAYIADVTKSGIRSVAAGQLDAGLSLGHSYWQIFRYVIVPQAMKVTLPPMTTQYVSVIKNSAVVGLVAIQDLTFETQEINVQTFRGFEAATAATVLYIILAMVVIGAMTLLQKRWVAS